MADYQEYRRRILHRRWRRVFIIVALLALLSLLAAIGILWKVLHRERVDTALNQNTILRQVTTDNTWNTVSYPLARQLRVQTLENGTETALDFRMAALPATAPVEKLVCAGQLCGRQPDAGTADLRYRPARGAVLRL